MCFCGYENDVYILWSKKEIYPVCVFVSIRMQGKKKEKKRFNMKIYHYYHFTYHFGNPSPNIFRNINICVIISKSGEDVKTIIQFALTY